MKAESLAKASMRLKKARTPSHALRLEQIPNIGPALAEDLRQIGIQRPEQLKDKDGIALYHRLNRVLGQRQDPCVADTFMAAVDFMRGGAPRPWWYFTALRKKIFLNKNYVTYGQ